MLSFLINVAGAGGGGEGAVKEGVSSLVENQDSVMLALIALVASSIAALAWVIRNGRYAKQGAEDAAAANAAVNNIGPGQHSLYDMIENIKADIESLKKDQDIYDAHGWETLPADLSTAVGLTTTIRDLQRGQSDQILKLDTLLAEIRAHVEWEMNHKYRS